MKKYCLVFILLLIFIGTNTGYCQEQQIKSNVLQTIKYPICKNCKKGVLLPFSGPRVVKPSINSFVVGLVFDYYKCSNCGFKLQ